MTRRQMENKIEELSEELRQLKAKDESHGHCHGCHCGHVIYWPYTSSVPVNTSTIPVKWTTNYSSGAGNYQITG